MVTVVEGVPAERDEEEDEEEEEEEEEEEVVMNVRVL